MTSDNRVKVFSTPQVFTSPAQNLETGELTNRYYAYIFEGSFHIGQNERPVSDEAIEKIRAIADEAIYGVCERIIAIQKEDWRKHHVN